MSRYKLDWRSATDELSKLDIVHMYGSMGHLDVHPYSPLIEPGVVRELATGIKTMPEIKKDYETVNSEIDELNGGSGFVSAVPQMPFIRVRESLEKAEKIIFLGFGFHSENIERFAFDFNAAGTRGVEIHACIGKQSGQGQLQMSSWRTLLEKYGVHTEFPFVDCNQVYISVTDLR